MADEKKEHREFWSHFPKKISKAMVEYVTESVFISSRYLFVYRVGKDLYGYCTHCKKEYIVGTGKYKLKPLKHNDSYKCHNTKCNSLVIVKESWRGRKQLIDQAYFVWYDRSRRNPKAIVARGIEVRRDYSGDYRNMETQYREVAAYLFVPREFGKKTDPCVQLNQRGIEWYQVKTIRSEYWYSQKYKHNCSVAIESVISAVKGTPFQYSMWKEYADKDTDLIRFFDTAAKYPCVEYLTKLGLKKFVEEKVYRGNDYGTVYWRGDTLEKVLRLTKAEIKELRSVTFDFEPRSLKAYQFFKKKGIRLTFEQAHFLEGLADSLALNMLENLLQDHSLEKKIRYVLKQGRREDGKSFYGFGSSVVYDWRDYLKECQELGMDLTREHVQYPNNLHAAHQKTQEKVKIKADERLNMLIANRLPELQKKYSFEHDGYLIRPVTGNAELFHEGEKLKHCVGRYGKEYAEGETDLLVVRKVEDPDTPFYTMEIRSGEVLQCRGFKNCAMTEEVKALVESFKAAKLSPKKQKKNIIHKQNERLEVAV